jgi:transposase
MAGTRHGQLSDRISPKSALGKAMTYARNQRKALRQYVDNNVSERTLRLQAIGRTNWEFIRSVEAGPRFVAD